MPERGKDLQATISETARRKKRVAEVRFGGTPVSGDVPREVYAAACHAIAGALEADGYTYAKSGPRLSRKAREFAFHISFQSSHHNIPGELVALWIHANVTSPTLKKWRSGHPCLSKGSDFVGGGQIGNLLPQHSWMEWNLALPTEREREIDDAIAAIRRVVFPYFAMFDDIPQLMPRLVSEDLPSFDVASALDFLMCFGSPTDALQAAKRMLRELPGAKQRYPAALDRFRREGLPPHMLTVHGEVLAAATVIYDFNDLGSEAA
jgi:hypothetical protein